MSLVCHIFLLNIRARKIPQIVHHCAQYWLGSPSEKLHLTSEFHHALQEIHRLTGLLTTTMVLESPSTQFLDLVSRKCTNPAIPASSYSWAVDKFKCEISSQIVSPGSHSYKEWGFILFCWLNLGRIRKWEVHPWVSVRGFQKQLSCQTLT